MSKIISSSNGAFPDSSDQADDLDNFLNKSNSRIQLILNSLNWNEVVQSPPAPIFANFYTEPVFPTTIATKNCISLTEAELKEVAKNNNAQIPDKFSDLQINFSRKEKIRIYEDTIQNAGKCTDHEPKIALLTEKGFTFADIVAEKHREKKNKRRHRKSKPTQSEEFRALIQLQMQAFEEYMASVERKEVVDHDKRHKEYQQKDVHRKKDHYHDSHHPNTFQHHASRDEKSQHPASRQYDTPIKHSRTPNNNTIRQYDALPQHDIIRKRSKGRYETRYNRENVLAEILHSRHKTSNKSKKSISPRHTKKSPSYA